MAVAGGGEIDIYVARRPLSRRERAPSLPVRYDDPMSNASSLFSAFVAATLAALLVIACVGDDPRPSSGPSGPIDASSEVSPEPQGGTCTALTSTDQFFDCPLAKGGKERCSKASQACCPGVGCTDRAGGCPDGANKYDCIASPGCSSEGKVCCISGVFDPAPVCGNASVIKPGATGAGHCIEPALCNTAGGMLQLCTTGSDCGVGECTPTAIVANGVSFVFSAC